MNILKHKTAISSLLFASLGIFVTSTNAALTHSQEPVLAVDTLSVCDELHYEEDDQTARYAFQQGNCYLDKAMDSSNRPYETGLMSPSVALKYAISWFEQARDRGHEEASERLNKAESMISDLKMEKEQENTDP